MKRLYLTFLGAGLSPIAPGTVGSIVAALVAYLLLTFADYLTLILLGTLIFIFSIKIIDEYELSHEHDASEIVIDEVSGVFMAIGVAFAGLNAQGLVLHHSLEFSLDEWVIFIASVLLFRVFDILKPSIIGRIDKQAKGGLGVMADDYVAGLAAAFASIVLYGAYIKFIKGLL